MGKKTKEQIHTNMSHVKNSDTALENALCAELMRRGIRSFSRNARTIILKKMKNTGFKFSIKGNSMVPIYRENDTVIIEKINKNEISVGDIVLTKQGVLHRVVCKYDTLLLTKGDNNYFFDNPCLYDDILGIINQKDEKYSELNYRDLNKKEMCEKIFIKIMDDNYKNLNFIRSKFPLFKNSTNKSTNPIKISIDPTSSMTLGENMNIIINYILEKKDLCFFFGNDIYDKDKDKEFNYCLRIGDRIQNLSIYDEIISLFTYLNFCFDSMLPREKHKKSFESKIK